MKRLGRADTATLMVVLIWGSNVSIVKHSLEEIQPVAFNAVRMAIATILLGVYVWGIRGGSLPLRRDWPRLFLLGILGNCLYQLFFIIGVHATTAGHTALLLSTATIFIAVLNHLAKHERLTRSTAIGILTSLIGVTLILLESLEVGISAQYLKGDLLILLSSFCWATYTVYSRDMLRKYSSPVFSATTLGMGSAVFILISIPYLLSQDWAAVSARANLELLYSAVFALVISYLLFFYAVGILGSTRTSIYTNLIPFSGLLFAWLFLGESIGLLQLAGGCLIVAGIRVAR